MSAVVEKKPKVEKQLPAIAKLVPASADGTALMRIIEKAALDPQFDVAKLKELLAVRDQWAATEARNAYNEAFASFKSEAIVILRNKDVTDGPLKGKKYAELYMWVNAVTPMLSKYGLSHSWKLTKDDKDWIEVTCSLKHVLGHAESVSMGGPPDTGGAKNAIQARVSTVSYLERHTLKAACGLAEQGDDNDGNVTGGQIDENAFADHLSAIDSAADEAALKKAFAQAWSAAEAINDVKAMKKFGDRKEARKAKLRVRA